MDRIPRSLERLAEELLNLADAADSAAGEEQAPLARQLLTEQAAELRSAARRMIGRAADASSLLEGPGADPDRGER